jgi:anti-sigma B factor antagonist
VPVPLVLSESIVSPMAPRWAEFRCTVRENSRDAAWIRVAGELDLATAPRLEQALHNAEVRARRVVLDLRALTFMDCSGVGVIAQSNKRAREAGGRLLLVRGPVQVDRVFALTGTADALEIVDLDPFQPPVQALGQPAQSDGP